MPYFIVTAAYLDPGEGPVEPYGWAGEAADRNDAVAQTQEECHDSMESDDRSEPLVEIIDVWEVHPDDVGLSSVPSAYARMRAV